MSVASSLHTSDLTNKYPIVVKFKDWPSGQYPRSSYITLEFSQLGEGEITLFIRRSMYCDLIAGMEAAARQLREIVAKEMVQTWGFPKAELCTAACDNPTEAHCTNHCPCYEAGHDAGLEAQREPAGRGTA